MVRILESIDYRRKEAGEIIKRKLGWRYYGEHHHENIFIKWAIGYWMYEKFNIDKRIITYSSQVLSGVISRQETLDIISKNPYNEDNIPKNTEYILKKLGLFEAEFYKLWKGPNKSFMDYPSYFKTIKSNAKFINCFFIRFLKIRPKIFVELSERQDSPL